MSSTTLATEHRQPLSAAQTYARYGVAGGLCASLTHLATVPLDVVKTRLQIAPAGQYTSTNAVFQHIRSEQGLRGLTVGWGPTLVGYFLQGACKFGFNEYFKKQAIKTLGEEEMKKEQKKLLVFLASGAAAECVGSFMLTPWEAIRIRMVSQPDFAPNMLSGLNRMVSTEGVASLYRGLGPILAKQVPYTMTQFASFQYTLEAAYTTVLPSLCNMRREDMSSGQQLAVSTAAGAVAGVVSAICSHPPDSVLSRINMARKAGGAPPTMMSCIKELGFRGLWKGIGIRCTMVGTISAGMFLIYDSVKVLTGLPTSK